MSAPEQGRISYGDRIVQDQRICGGQTVFKGTRVTLRTVLASLTEGDSIKVILREFPSLKPEDIRAAIAFAAARAVEDLRLGSVPGIFDEDQI